MTMQHNFTSNKYIHSRESVGLAEMMGQVKERQNALHSLVILRYQDDTISWP